MSTYYAGIDSGSWTTKAIVIDDATAVIGKAVVRTDAELSSAAERSFAEALEDAGVERSDLEAIWATGFGRQSVSFADSTRTELDCHARGVRHYIPGALTVVDIGGQDAKVIRLDEDGRRISHRMNRKCAAGTGSFLEEMSLRLGVRIDQFHDLALKFEEEFELGSFCTVFTGTEVLAAIRQGRRPSDLARAGYRSVVRRILEMDVLDGPLVGTGGVIAHHPMVLELIEEALGTPVQVPPHPQEIGAFGAALAAKGEVASVRSGAGS
jgi:predicted CoA-substrate-specific enzyme activase